MHRLLLLSDSAAYVAAVDSALRVESVLLRQETSLTSGLVVAREWRPRLLLLDLGLPLGGAPSEPAKRSSSPGGRAGVTGGGLAALLRDPAIEDACRVLAIAAPEQLALLGPGVPVGDFIVPPLDEEELRVRVLRALWHDGGEDGTVLRRGGVVIDLERYTVTVDGEVVDLTYKEYELLAFLAGSPGRPFTRQALLDRVWGYDYYGGARTVDVHVRRIRSKIEGRRQYIDTVRNVGYRFIDG
jgi:DNA-binding response OmpR family regulator